MTKQAHIYIHNPYETSAYYSLACFRGKCPSKKKNMYFINKTLFVLHRVHLTTIAANFGFTKYSGGTKNHFFNFNKKIKVKRVKKNQNYDVS